MVDLRRVLVLALACAARAELASTQQSPIRERNVSYRDVETEQGIVRGYNSDAPDVYTFYGIPYAAAPQGEDRFKAPLPPQKRTDIFNATERNIICPQRNFHSDTFLVLNRTTDCLRLNIFTPATLKKNLPVMVYIHGGSFQEGYGMIFSPEKLASTGIVAITINYRLGVHGFLCLGTEFAPGNAGFRDQVAALKWVRDNIRNFRGDPDNVLLAGSSAGSMSAELLMLSSMATGLFKKVALESGSALASIATDQTPIITASNFASQHKVDTEGDVENLEQFYKSLSDGQLNDGYSGKGLDVGFRLCIETHNITGVEKFLTESPRAIIRSGNYEKRQLLTGFTAMEGLLFIGNYDAWKLTMANNLSQFLPTDIKYSPQIETRIKSFYHLNDEITYEAFTDFFTDTFIAYPMFASARKHALNSAQVYMYLFRYNGSINLPPMSTSPIWGPGHVAQSLYLQQYDDKTIYAHVTRGDAFVAQYMRWIYGDFMSDGSPNLRMNAICDNGWLPVSNETANYLEITDGTFYPAVQGARTPLKERLNFWDEIYTAQNGAIALKCTTVLQLLGIIVIKKTLITAGFSS